MATDKWKEEHKEEMRRYRREWYQRNKEKSKDAVVVRRKGISQWMDDLKGTLSCVLCGESHPSVLQFHHRDPVTKEIEISVAVKQNNWSKERILAEMEKCDVLCANCHLKEHYNSRVSLV